MRETKTKQPRQSFLTAIFCYAIHSPDLIDFRQTTMLNHSLKKKKIFEEEIDSKIR